MSDEICDEVDLQERVSFYSIRTLHLSPKTGFILYSFFFLLPSSSPKKGDLIGGFYVTQVSLIITQVSRKLKNKIAYHLINWVKKFKYRSRVINEQCANDSGMYDIPNSSYSAKVITENYSV